MSFSCFFPFQDDCPAVFCLAGLTCDYNTFLSKSNAVNSASSLKIALICPDTSPRVNGDWQGTDWQIGAGAGFYVDAKSDQWSNHYQMFSYINYELVKVVSLLGKCDMSRLSIMGHSMGGHGALISYLKNPIFKSASAFAPIVNPTNCDWGKNAFNTYGVDGTEYDFCCLLKDHHGELNIKVDQGTLDKFLLNGQLRYDEMIKVVGENKDMNLRQGYDHSYWFIQTFIQDHLEFHAKHLN